MVKPVKMIHFLHAKKLEAFEQFVMRHGTERLTERITIGLGRSRYSDIARWFFSTSSSAH
jgi:hypothetical protein